ncbi:alpha/beta hydrolase [Aliihoeflea sp. PC F10.4]
MIAAHYQTGLRVFFFVPLLFLAACGSGASHDMLNVLPAAEGTISAEHRIFVATTRESAANANEIYGGGRSGRLDFVDLEVTIPATHQIGRIENPSGNAPRDPAQHFAARDIQLISEESVFERELRADIAKNNGRALVFIHGYRTPFDKSVYRAAQIKNDAAYRGTTVLFSWASTGRTVDYLYDNNSASVARDGLERTLSIVKNAGATRIDIIAHSMGNWILMEALRQFAISGRTDLRDALGDVVLASPDIDVDVFRSQMERIGRPDRPFVIMLSDDDRALQISSILAGNRPRVGDYGDSAELAGLGVTVVNLSAVRVEDRLNHTKFAENPILIQMLGEQLARDDLSEETVMPLDQQIAQLAGGVGQTVGSAAAIVITTPLEVINVAIGQ